MMIKRKVSFMFFVLSVFVHFAAAQELSPVKMIVNEQQKIKPYDSAILGFNFDWTGQQSLITNYDHKNPRWIEKSNGEIRPDMVQLLQGYPINLSRIAGTNSQYLSWKKSIGPLAGRPTQKIEKWAIANVIGYGPVEWIKHVKGIDPSAKLIWCVNLTESPQEAADLAEFLTGDPAKPRGKGENWAAKRVALGVKEPVSIYAWELGNESDGTDAYHNYPTIQSYTDKCRKVIAAIKSIDPDARFAAQASTMNHQKDYKQKYGGEWDIWHRTVLKELGSQIDFLVFHPYFGNRLYAGNQPDNSFWSTRQKMMEKDILAITGSNRIKFLISEYGFWPEKAKGHNVWEQSWYTTHALIGCLSVADWINRMINSPSVAAAAMHALSGGPWGIYYTSQRNEAGKSQPCAPYFTAQGDLFRLMSSCFENGKDVVAASVSGDRTKLETKGTTFSAATVTTPDGLAVLLVNQEPVPRKLDFSAQSHYTLASWKCFTGNSLDARNDSTRKEIQIKLAPGVPGEFKIFEVPARSVVALKLTRI